MFRMSAWFIGRLINLFGSVGIFLKHTPQIIRNASDLSQHYTHYYVSSKLWRTANYVNHPIKKPLPYSNQLLCNRQELQIALNLWHMKK